MARIVVYCSTPAEGRNLREQLAPILDEWEEPPFYREFIGDSSGFLHYIRENPYMIIMVVQSGPEGKENVRLTKQSNPKAGVVWFAQEDYALDAFAIHITYFARLPVDQEKLLSALEGCFIQQEKYAVTMTV